MKEVEGGGGRVVDIKGEISSSRKDLSVGALKHTRHGALVGGVGAGILIIYMHVYCMYYRLMYEGGWKTGWLEKRR